jgi:cholesterol oxidase
VTAERLDHDVVVVGSGFGGSVAALRLAEKGYDVLVYEAGRRFADHELPRTSWDLRRYLWAPALGLFGIQRIHRLPDVLVLAGAGVGGGSLNYANTLYVPPEPFFRDRQWAHITDWQAELAPHYDQASRMLGVVTNPCEGPVEQVMRQAAADLGVAGTFRKTPVGVLFGAGPAEQGREVDDPYFGGAGPRRTTCTECGSCMTGCRVGAKNTLVKNYLALAERLGVRVEPMRTVVDVEPLGVTSAGENGSDAAGYRVTTRRTGPLGRTSTRSVTTRHVVLAAGAWGTQALLHDLRRRGRLPRLSERVGHLTRTNSEALLGALVPRVPTGADLSHGVAITSSFHPDDDTHVENCRYGAGSNAMGLLATLLVDGGPGGPRWRKFLAYAARHPRELGVAASVRRWSQRTVIGLVMQSRDNSLVVSGRRRLLGGTRLVSRQGHGEPNPSWIPAGHAAIRALAARLGAATGQPAYSGGTVGDLFDVPMTAHFLGGCAISDDPAAGVVDPYHRVHGHPGISVVDGSAISANLGVNPSLSITAQAERAMSLWPNAGEPDPRPAPGEAYVRLDPVRPVRPAVPEGAPAALPLTVLRG